MRIKETPAMAKKPSAAAARRGSDSDAEDAEADTRV
jgi:hypothetical protein